MFAVEFQFDLPDYNANIRRRDRLVLDSKIHHFLNVNRRPGGTILGLAASAVEFFRMRSEEGYLLALDRLHEHRCDHVDPQR